MQSDPIVAFIVGVVLILLVVVSRRLCRRGKSTPTATKPPRATRTRNPKPFAGFIHKPDCPMYKQEAEIQSAAQRLVHQVTRGLAPHCVPLFLTDGFGEYLTALVTHYGQWMHPACRHDTGPQPKPRWMPLPGLLYAPVVKRYRRRRLVGVTHRVIFGPTEIIESILAKRGWRINTAFAERLNLDFRQHVAAIGRRVNTLCKHEAGLRQQLTLFHVCHNFVLPHAGLRLPELEPVPGTDAIKRWQPRTPAMAVGLTDRVWRLREVLLYRVPPWPQIQMD